MFGIYVSNLVLLAIKAVMADVWTLGCKIGHHINKKNNKAISKDIDMVNMSTDSLIFRICFNDEITTIGIVLFFPFNFFFFTLPKLGRYTVSPELIGLDKVTAGKNFPKSFSLI